jgi:hypothetical protein
MSMSALQLMFVGHHLEKYDMRPTTSGCRVTFLFDNGRNVTIDNVQFNQNTG